MDSCYKDGIIRMLNYKDNKKNLVNLTHFSSFELDNNTIWFKTTINDVFPIYFSNSEKALTYFNDINESLVGYYKCKNIKK
jgi:hypothetical protein